MRFKNVTVFLKSTRFSVTELVEVPRYCLRQAQAPSVPGRTR